ncbi:hypothetical protein ACFE04_007802 [Oxalis oulophora]
MRVERASLDQVRDRFDALKKRKEPGSFTEHDLDERIVKQQEEEEERKRQRREKKKEKKKEKVPEEEPEVDPDMAAMMGFGAGVLLSMDFHIFWLITSEPSSNIDAPSSHIQQVAEMDTLCFL